MHLTKLIVLNFNKYGKRERKLYLLSSSDIFTSK